MAAAHGALADLAPSPRAIPRTLPHESTADVDRRPHGTGGDLSTSCRPRHWPILVIGATAVLFGLAQLGERPMRPSFAGIGLLPFLVLFAACAVASGRSNRSDLRRGGILVAVGLWLLASSMHLGGLDYSSSWPLLLVLIGVVLAIFPAGRKGRMSGIMLMAWGALAAIATNDLWGFGWWDIWPLFLVVVGVEMVWQAVADQRRRSGRSRESNHE